MLPVKPFSVRQTVAKEFTNRLSFDGASRPQEGVCAEKLGFDTTLYRSHPPALLKRFGTDPSMEIRRQTVSPSYPAAFSVSTIKPDPRPRILLESRDGGVKVLAMALDADSDWMINADGDMVLFSYSGCGRFYTPFGELRVDPMDFVYIPRGVPYQFQGAAVMAQLFIGIESSELIQKPDFGPYINADIPYSDQDLQVPIPFSVLTSSDDEWGVWVKRADIWKKAIYQYRPDCLGWRGSVYPFALSVRDIHPLSAHTKHLDPTAYTVFAAASGSVSVQAFLPRYLHSLPYYHMGSHDEFLFLAKPYAARGGIVGAGDATFHPQGFYHGPNPKALEEWQGPQRVDECAVMFESRSPLFPTVLAQELEIPDYRYH